MFQLKLGLFPDALSEFGRNEEPLYFVNNLLNEHFVADTALHWENELHHSCFSIAGFFPACNIIEDIFELASISIVHFA